MFFVELTIRYAPNKSVSMSLLEPEVYVRRLRGDLDVLKLPHPPEASLEILPRKGCKFFWETRRNSPLHSLVKKAVLEQNNSEYLARKRFCDVELISVRTGLNHEKSSETLIRTGSSSRRSSTPPTKSYYPDSHDSHDLESRRRFHSPPALHSLRRYRSLSKDSREEGFRDSIYSDRQRLPQKAGPIQRKCSFNSSEDSSYKPENRGQDQERPAAPRRSIGVIESLQVSLMAIDRKLGGSVTAELAPSRSTPQKRPSRLPLSSPPHQPLSVHSPTSSPPRMPSGSPIPFPLAPPPPLPQTHSIAPPHDTTHVDPMGSKAGSNVQHTQEEKETISKLTRQLWDTRRNMTALSARGLVIEDELRELKTQEEQKSNTTGEFAPACEHLGISELQYRLDVLEGLLREETRSRIKAEMILEDVLRECERPTIIPLMYDMFMLGEEKRLDQ